MQVASSEKTPQPIPQYIIGLAHFYSPFKISLRDANSWEPSLSESHLGLGPTPPYARTHMYTRSACYV